MRISRRTRLGAAVAGLLVAGTGVGAWQAVAADDVADPNDPPERIAPDGSIIPEPDPAPGAGDAIETRDDVARIERMIDPNNDPATFVCANKGDFEVRVVEGHTPPADAKANVLAGPSITLDPCLGFDWVVGR